MGVPIATGRQLGAFPVFECTDMRQFEEVLGRFPGLKNTQAAVGRADPTTVERNGVASSVMKADGVNADPRLAPLPDRRRSNVEPTGPVFD